MKPLDRLRRISLSFPEAYEEETWGEVTFRVRKKIFCIAGGNDPRRPSLSASLKATLADQQALLAQGEPYFLPPYVGHKGWIGVDLSHAKLDWGEVTELVTESYRLVAPKRLAAQLP